MIPVDFEKTIARKRLVRDDDNWWRTVILCVWIAGATLVLYLFYADYRDSGVSTKVHVFVFFPLLALVSGFLLYKKLNEKKIWEIPTAMDAKTAKAVVTKYLSDDGWEIAYSGDNNLIATRTLDMSFNDEKQTTVIFFDGSILLNVTRNYHVYDVRRWYISVHRYGSSPIPLIYADIAVRKGIIKALGSYVPDQPSSFTPS